MRGYLAHADGRALRRGQLLLLVVLLLVVVVLLLHRALTHGDGLCYLLCFQHICRGLLLPLPARWGLLGHRRPLRHLDACLLLLLLLLLLRVTVVPSTPAPAPVGVAAAARPRRARVERVVAHGTEIEDLEQLQRGEDDDEDSAGDQPFLGGLDQRGLSTMKYACGTD
jgi:hypothetical protein